MKKRIALLTWILMGVICLSGAGVARAEQVAEVINVGNKFCPISGEEIGSMGETITVEHEGKSYNLCCKMCVKDFKKNPEKYIKNVEDARLKAHAEHTMTQVAEEKEMSEQTDPHTDDGHGAHEH